MSKVKYYYDSETLSYRKIERKKRTTFAYASLFLLGTFLFSLIIFFIANLYVESPKEKALNREASKYGVAVSITQQKNG